MLIPSAKSHKDFYFVAGISVVRIAATSLGQTSTKFIDLRELYTSTFSLIIKFCYFNYLSNDA